MLSYGLASGTWAGINAEEAAARGVTLVQPDRDPAALRGYTERALTGGLSRSSASASRSSGPPTPTPPSRRARRIGKTLLEVF